ncbi:twin-arginine translocase subunit TatB [Candidatus Fukatsuia symbiotica]|uniref:Sec-independent protein translocase protein TatB n=1 Tax=Candidatus Fukatsuia symbiotica TaxID=1878942 RepID=A0A2U8I998_9GAMM|nr:twin-arginine translocase subunit TatB [Candidatus Fukatsuia symbiotica]
MFDIGFGELLLIMVIGLVVLGPQRLPVAVRTVTSWIKTLRSLATTVQQELSQELKLQELQDSLKKAKQAGLQGITPELQASIDELKHATKTLQQTCHTEKSHAGNNPQLIDPEAIHDEVVSTTPISTTATDNIKSIKPRPHHSSRDQ